MTHCNPVHVTVEPACEAEVSAEPALEIQVVTVAEQGPPGPPGGMYFGGFPVEIETPQAGDMVVFEGDAWVNQHKERLSDGGNF